MSRHRKDPLRLFTSQERQALTDLNRAHRAPAAQVDRARALLAIEDRGAAAHSMGRLHSKTHSRLGQPLQPRGAGRGAVLP
jgi:hypothetical protein